MNMFCTDTYKPAKVKAFTLVEVLITLGVIGIVAALTIPSLISSTNDAQTVAKLKKFYATMTNATDAIKYDCGGSVENCLSTITNNSTCDNELGALYAAKLNILKSCGTSTGCFANEQYKRLLGGGVGVNLDTYTGGPKYILADGISFQISCYNSTYFYFWTDVNGAKPPNQYGRDLFFFSYYYDTKTIRPWNGDCVGVGESHDMYCAGKVLLEDAINY